MAFKIPPVSPLLGSTVLSFIRTVYGRKIEPKNYFKLTLSFIVVLISSLFQWVDILYFRIKARASKQYAPPVFIIGHWRTGTTFLHNILARDPKMGFVTTYQTVFPNNMKSKFLFRPFMRLHMPEKRPGDNVKLGVGFPQEDEFALSNMTAYNFYQYMYFPRDYREYYEKFIRFKGVSTKTEKIWRRQYKRMITKAMIDGGGMIPLVKNPCNTARIGKMLELYPGAKFICTVRNPVIVILSSKKFFSELFPTISLHQLSEYEMEEMLFDIYDMLIHDYLEQKHLVPEGDLLEIKFDNYEEDPLSYVKSIYDAFQLEGFDENRHRFDQYIESLSSYKKNKHKVSREYLDRILDRCGFAMKLWGYDMPENVEIL